jgi:hypothetical protein
MPEPEIVVPSDPQLRREFLLLIKFEVKYEMWREGKLKLSDVDAALDMVKDFRKKLESD